MFFPELFEDETPTQIGLISLSSQEDRDLKAVFELDEDVKAALLSSNVTLR